MDSLANHAALKKAPVTLKHQLAGGRGRVDRLLVQVKINAARL